MNTERYEGTVVRSFPSKGYVFLRVEGRDEDYFLHADDVGGLVPDPGAVVSFTIRHSPRGVRASNAKVIA